MHLSSLRSYEQMDSFKIATIVLGCLLGYFLIVEAILLCSLFAMNISYNELHSKSDIEVNTDLRSFINKPEE